MSFDRRSSGFRFLINEVKNSVFRAVTKDSSELFFRGKDVISINPQTNALHEPDLTSFIDHCVKCGYDDFLLDVGANIGLTTSQSGHAFKKIICFEPNPLCLHILRANIEVSDLASKVEVREYGLGENDGVLELWVPRRNLGGAFVRSSQNSYTQEVLAAKDGFGDFDERAYLKRTIELRSAESAFADAFRSLALEGLSAGIVKIDVEGMERVVLQGLARSLPRDSNCVIIFENFDPHLDLAEISSLFPGQAKMGKLSNQRPFKRKVPRAVQALCLMFMPSKYSIESADAMTDREGDLILIVGDQTLAAPI
jgi:FkbM family methyltransferase